MASVSSLDKDMRNIRLSRYTPQAANEVRVWIESVLGERLAAGDLLDALKDGIALCRLVNLAAPNGVRYKESSMPFVQMENISHFLRACQQPPLSLHSHDVFQTVDLYESKDPAQVLQCIGAFSRRAHAVQPSRFSNSLGAEKSKGGVISPQNSGSGATARTDRARGMSNTSETSSSASYAVGGRGSPTRAFDGPPSRSLNGGATSPSGGISSWSKRQDETATAPAWNIHQYGYMGGASQGNQGISFGARRQITTPAPQVPSLAEKERKRKEQEVEVERLRLQAEEAERTRKREREAEGERQRIAEEKRWEEETEKQRDAERKRVEEEKKRWEEEERRWKEEEENRAREEAENEARSKSESGRFSTGIDSRPKLQGQSLSQYQAEQTRRLSGEDPQLAKDRERVKELERQLEEAKEREARYERERQERLLKEQEQGRGRSRRDNDSARDRSRSKSQNRKVPYGSNMEHDEDDPESERNLLQKAWQATNDESNLPLKPPRPLPTPETSAPPPPKPPRPLPTPQSSSTPTPMAQSPSPSPSPPPPVLPSRPLPNPATYTQPRSSPSPTRKSPFTRPTATPSPPPSLSHASVPKPSSIPPTQPSRLIPSPSSSPSPFKKPPSSLLAREMELDRLRQQEWAESQAATAARKPDPSASNTELGPGGGAWDVHQYGYLGGDSQNRGNVGIGGFGGARRQLVGGPRDMPGSGKGEDGKDGRG